MNKSSGIISETLFRINLFNIHSFKELFSFIYTPQRDEEEKKERQGCYFSF